MSLLALDIETAPGTTNPPELLAIAVAYQPKPGEPIDQKLFTRTNDDPLFAATNLIGKVESWVSDRSPNYTITYSDSNDIEQVLREWAGEADAEYNMETVTTFIDTLYENHVNLHRPAAAVHAESGAPLPREDAFSNAAVEYTLPKFEWCSLPDSVPALTGVMTPETIAPVRVAFHDVVENPESTIEDCEAFEIVFVQYMSARLEPLLELAEELRQTI